MFDRPITAVQQDILNRLPEPKFIPPMPPVLPPKICTWTEESQGAYWSAGCDATGGSLFAFTEGGPFHNKFKRCPYCGKTLVEAPASFEIDDED